MSALAPLLTRNLGFRFVAVAVTASAMKRTKPGSSDSWSAEIRGLEQFKVFARTCIRKCWDGDPEQRPSFGREISHSSSLYLLVSYAFYTLISVRNVPITTKSPQICLFTQFWPWDFWLLITVLGNSIPCHSIVLFQATTPIETIQTLNKKTENQYRKKQ